MSSPKSKLKKKPAHQKKTYNKTKPHQHIYNSLYTKDSKQDLKQKSKINENQKETTFTINNKQIIFSSNFNSGNMKSIAKQEESQLFEIELHSDSEDNERNIKKNRSWFFFSVKTVFNFNNTFMFNIKNITNQYKNYLDGYKPVFYICRNKDDHDQLPNGFLNEKDLLWERLESEVNVVKVDPKDEDKESEKDKPYRGLCDVSWRFKFNEEMYSVYFAFCFPYSYNKIIRFCEKYVNDIYVNQAVYDYKSKEYKIFNKSKYNSDTQYNNAYRNILNSSWLKDQIYCHKEVLTYSREGRKIELITISSFDQITSSKEYLLKGLFGSNSNMTYMESNASTTNRCFAFSQEKQIIFITSRVHPAETTSSYLLEGLMNFLSDEKDLRSRLLRRYFVFKIIPIINPDGVSNGFYRFDSNGFNLNRHYVNPDSQITPEVYAVKRLFTFYSQQFRLKHFFDLHGHFSSKGHFAFMNSLDFVNQVETLTIPFLVACLNQDFIFKSCVYSEKSMKSKEFGDKFTKEGSSRVYFYKSCGVTSSYTIEVSGYRSPYMLSNSKYNTEFGDIPNRHRENINYISSSDLEYNKEVLSILDIDYESKNEIRNHEMKFDLYGNYVYQDIIRKDIKDFFTIQCYMRLACDLLTTILEYDEINPYIMKNKVIPSEYLGYMNEYDEVRKVMHDRKRKDICVLDNRSIRSILCSKLIKEEEKFKSNNLNKQYANNIEEVRKRSSIYDKYANKHKRLVGYDKNEKIRLDKESMERQIRVSQSLKGNINVSKLNKDRNDMVYSDSARLVSSLKLPKI